MLICLYRQHRLQVKGLQKLPLLRSYEGNTCEAPRPNAELGSLGADNIFVRMLAPEKHTSGSSGSLSIKGHF